MSVPRFNAFTHTPGLSLAYTLEVSDIHFFLRPGRLDRDPDNAFTVHCEGIHTHDAIFNVTLIGHGSCYALHLQSPMPHASTDSC